MIWFYRLIFIPLFLVSFPYYLKRMLKRGGYGRDVQHRWGKLPKLPKKQEKLRIWAHAVSVGEINAIRPLLEELKKTLDAEIVLSTTTSTGYKLAKDKMQELCLQITYFPIDFWLFSQRAWNIIRPDALVLMEAELWPEHLHQAKKHDVPVFLVNARLSDRSYRRYAKAGWISRRILNKPTAIMPSSEQDLERFVKLGIAREKLTCTGNLKCDSPLPPIVDSQRNTLRRELFGDSIQESTKILLGSSTWPDEEKFLLEVYRQAKGMGMDVRLLIIPRHAERRDSLKELFSSQPESYRFRTEKDSRENNPEVYIADTTGELTRLTTVADVAFIGKSLPPNKGGQTPIEAVGMGIPTVMGPEMSNFRQISQEMLNFDAARQGHSEGGVSTLLISLLREDKQCMELSNNGKSWHKAQQGAIRRTVDAIRRNLS
jgi:3-deoxy-D-manno-octulosonic-acid transferase